MPRLNGCYFAYLGITRAVLVNWDSPLLSHGNWVFAGNECYQLTWNLYPQQTGAALCGPLSAEDT